MFYHHVFSCQNTDGGFLCSCPNGLVGDPYTTGCRKPGDCFSDNDCPATAFCQNSRCKNPCSEPSTCGINAECIASDHQAACKCPPQTRGNPLVECIAIECEDSADCTTEKACINSHCVDPCTLPNACGQKALCTSQNHVGFCSCEPGYTGDPQLGCVQLQYCAKDTQCTSGTRCINGLCSCKYLIFFILTNPSIHHTVVFQERKHKFKSVI